MTLKEPIVEGACYLREDGQVLGPAAREPLLRDVFPLWRVGLHLFTDNGTSADTIQACGPRLTRRVYLVPTDPAEVVTELRARSESESKLGRYAYDTKEAYHDGRERAYESAADLVAEKLGLTPAR